MAPLAVVMTLAAALPALCGPVTAQEPRERGFRTGAQRPGQPTRDTATPQATGTARIRGIVVAADTGTPLRRAVIRVNAPELRDGRTTMTDAEGRYEIKDLPAARYTLTATKSGYVALQYGQRRPFEQGRPLELRNGEQLDGVNLALPRGSVITGRIVDEFGEPVAEAMVSAMRYQYVRGRRQLFPAGRPVQTNDLGQFRLYGLPPGEYYVSANLRSFGFLDQSAPEVSGFAPTYFPGTASPGEAQRVAVSLGQEAVADFSLIPTRLVRLSGTVIDSSGRPVTSGFVRLVQSAGVGGGFMMFGFSGGRIQPDGSFTMGGVTPGTYTLMATAREFGPMADDAEAESARMPLTVAGEDVTGVVLTTTKGATVRGQIVVEGSQASFNAASLRITTTSADTDEAPGPMGFGGAARVEDDWTFELRGLFGRRFANVNGLPQPWQLKAVYLGGDDVTDAGFEARGDPRGPTLQVVVTNQGTEVSGTVADSKGQPIKDYVVVLFADDSARWTHPLGRYTRVARPDQDGKYSVSGLPPAEYLAVALEYLENGAANDPEVLARLRDLATTVKLAEGEKKALALTLSQP